MECGGSHHERSGPPKEIGVNGRRPAEDPTEEVEDATEEVRTSLLRLVHGKLTA